MPALPLLLDASPDPRNLLSLWNTKARETGRDFLVFTVSHLSPGAKGTELDDMLGGGTDLEKKEGNKSTDWIDFYLTVSSSHICYRNSSLLSKFNIMCRLFSRQGSPTDGSCATHFKSTPAFSQECGFS